MMNSWVKMHRPSLGPYTEGNVRRCLDCNALDPPLHEICSQVQCAFEGCDQPATEIACGRAHGRYVNPGEGHGPYLMKQHPGHPTPAWYCSVHAELVADEDCPEYKEMCPNCGCRFGVN